MFAVCVLKPLLYARSHMRRAELVLHLSLLMLSLFFLRFLLCPIDRKILNTADDFPMLHFIYFSVPPLILTILPRYVNWFTSSGSFPWMLILSAFVVYLIAKYSSFCGLFWVKSSCCFSTSVAVLVSISSCLLKVEQYHPQNTVTNR